MFASLNPAVFSEITSLARAVISRNSTLPILQCVRLTIRPESPRTLTAEATDLDVSLTRSFTLTDPAVSGVICLPISELGKIRPDKTCEVLVHQWDPFNVAITATSGGARAVHHIELLPAADFPSDGSAHLDCTTTILRAATLRAIADSVSFQSDDQSRYVLNGCLIEPTALIACDGRRLVKFHVRGTPIPIILPRKTCQLIDLLNPSLAIAKIPFADPSTITFQLGDDVMLQSKLIEGNYPNYHQVIPAACGHKVTFADPEPVIKFLRHLDCKTRQSSVRLTPLPPYQLELRHTDATLVSAAHFAGYPESVAFNPRFLADCIETVGPTFSQEESRSPALFSSPNATGVLMAMRIADPPVAEVNVAKLPDAA